MIRAYFPLVTAQVRHSGASRNPFVIAAKAAIRPSIGEEVPLPYLLESGQRFIKLDPGFRRGDEESACL